MAITLVGTVQSGTAGNGGDVTLTFDGSPAQNDIVVVIGGQSNNGTANAAGINTSGYTNLTQFTNTNLSFGIWYKVLGASPDASVDCNGTGGAPSATCFLSFVLRGADTTTPSDATPSEEGPTSGGSGDCPSITTITDGAWVLACAFKTGHEDPPDGAPSGYSNLTSAVQNETVQGNLAAASKEVATAGAEDPGNWTTWTNGTWTYAITAAIRPAGAAADPANYLGNLESRTPSGVMRGVMRGAR